MTTYAELDALLHHRGHGRQMDRRRLSKSSYARRMSNQDIAICLVATDILVFHPDETVTLKHEGWRTQLTSSYINRYLAGSHVGSHYGSYSLTCYMPFDGVLIPVEVDFNESLTEITLTTETRTQQEKYTRYDGYYLRKLNVLVSTNHAAPPAPPTSDREIFNRSRVVAANLRNAPRTEDTSWARNVLAALQEQHDHRERVYRETLNLNMMGLTELEEAILAKGARTPPAIMTAKENE